MQKRIVLILIFILALSFNTGCQKSETEIREEIKAEMAAEAAQNGTTENVENKKADVKDLDAVFALLSTANSDLTKEDFNTFWKPLYFDFTKDGTLDVAYVDTAWYSNAVFITGDLGNLSFLESDEIYTEMNTTLKMDGDFLILNGTPHGSGLSGQYTIIACYDGKRVKNLTPNPLYTEYFAGAQSYQEGTGTITLNNGYSDFNYSYQVKNVDANGEEKMISMTNLNYAFNPDTSEYELGQIGENFSESDMNLSTTSESTTSTSVNND